MKYKWLILNVELSFIKKPYKPVHHLNRLVLLKLIDLRFDFTTTIMQIVHKINDFLFTIFPELENDNEKEIFNAIQKYYTYVHFVPKVTIDNDRITVEVDTEIIVTQEADYKNT